MKLTLQESIIPLNIHESTLQLMAPLIIKKSKVILELNELSKTHPSTYQYPSTSSQPPMCLALLAWAVKYANCTSAEG